jgi:hypothetical protein
MDKIAQVRTAGLTPQRDLDVALRDEHAQALWVRAEGRRGFELAVDPAYAVPDRDLISKLSQLNS